MPDIYGDQVVWVDHQSGNPKVVFLDLSDNVPRLVSSSSATQTSPAVWNDLVVWTDYRNATWNGSAERWENTDIYIRNMNTLDPPVNLTPWTGNQTSPDIYGQFVTFTDDSQGSYEIVGVAHLFPGVEAFRITSSSSLGGSSIWGKRLVAFWDSGMGGVMSTTIWGTPSFEQAGPGAELMPRVQGDTVVWQDTRNGPLYNNFDIYAASADLLSESVAVDNSPYNQCSPDVYGHLVVYSDHYRGNTAPNRISMKDLVTKYKYTVSSYSGGDPRIWGRTVVWMDARKGWDSGDIYGAVVRPYAKVGMPRLPSTTIGKGKTFKISGSLRPAHAVGAPVAKLYFARYESGKWRLKKTVSATCDAAVLGEGYKASTSLAYTGKWRVRAYHADAFHSPKYSSWKYFSVK